MISKSLFDTIQTRRSVRRFRPDPIPDPILFRILEAARWAPSGGNSQDWSFGVVTDHGRRRELAEAAGHQHWIADAPVILACCTHLYRPEEESDFGREVNDLRWGAETARWLRSPEDPYRMGLVMQNATPLIPGAHIQLAATSYGIGSCWIGYLDIARAGSILGLPQDWRCHFLMPLGYPDETERRDRKPLGTITFADAWGQPWLPADGGAPFGSLVLRPYLESDEEQWLNTWGQTAVTSYAWAVLAHAKPHYQRPALELVAEINGDIAGFMDVEVELEPGELGLCRDSRCGFVWEFGVRPDYRGRGMARRMIEAARDWCSALGVGRMEFWSADPHAQDFYRHMGMSEIEHHWQFHMGLPPDIARQMSGDGVGVFEAYGHCPVEKLDSIRDKYRLKTGPEGPKICVGFDFRW